MPDTASGAVESTQAEVDRVVEVAIEHALTRPDESLAIVTVTPLHADRIRDALLVEVRQNPALAGFFSGARAEPVVVADVSGVAGLVRDTIVLSVGFGRTPHGRVLHRFGILNTPGAEAMLLDAVGATRRRLHVVSCFTAGDLDPERLRGAGARLLAEVLDLAEQRSGAADQVTLGNGVDLGGSPDRLVLDLAERLWRAGLVVETDYGIGDGDRIPLVVGHPDLPGELLVAVLTDDAAYVAERSVACATGRSPSGSSASAGRSRRSGPPRRSSTPPRRPSASGGSCRPCATRGSRRRAASRRRAVVTGSSSCRCSTTTSSTATRTCSSPPVGPWEA